MLAAVMDGKLMVWYYPNVVLIDRDLVNQTKMVKDGSELGKDPQLMHFDGTHVTVRRTGGYTHTHTHTHTHLHTCSRCTLTAHM
jgi:intraflagellar transport protein 80